MSTYDDVLNGFESVDQKHLKVILDVVTDDKSILNKVESIALMINKEILDMFCMCLDKT